MFITKKHISRRTVLRGIGTAVALPLLDSMVPASTAWADTPAGKTPKRFAFIGFPHGAIMDSWSPKETGTNFTISPILKPLEPFRKHVTIVSGLRNKPAETPEPHAYIEQGWLTCVKPWDFGKGGPDTGVSADQMAVRYIGQDTRLPSLELTTSQGSARLAWRTPTQSLPQEGNPRAIFQKLFGQGDTDKERAQILAETGSILDRVQAQAQRLQSSLGVKDRVVVSDYLDSVREIERRVQMAAKADNSELVIPDAPVGTPNDITEYFKLMFDLMALAFQADITRVITLSMDREASMRTYTNLNIAEGFHPLSHHGNNPQKMDKLIQIQNYHTQVFAGFIKKIEAAKEANGTVLDHSTILFGSDMSNSDRHNNDPLPSVILGHASGKIKGGQHLKYPQDSRHADLLLTLLQRNDIPVKSIGDSAEGLSEVYSMGMKRFATGIAFLVAGASTVLAAENTLLDAAESGDRPAVMRMVGVKGANVNATGADGTTAIMYAAANGDLELVRALIKAGADVKLKNQLGTSAITEAAIIGSAPIIDALLKAGADANFRTPDGETPLMAAARSGKVDAAKALLDAGADINAKESWGGQNAIMWASAQSQAVMVKFLASKDAKLNEHGKINQWERKIIQEPRPKDMNKGGFTALHYAAREGCAACVENLLTAGADPDSEDPDRETPLLLALENLHFDTAAVLIKGGADLDKWDLFGRSPIYMAADVSTLPMKGNGGVAVLPSPDKLTAVEVGRMMLEKGANPNIQLKRRPPYRDVPQDRGGDGMLAQGATPLLRAARGGDDKFIALLLQYKAIVDLPSKEGITPLMAAAGVDYGSRATRGRNRTDEGVIASMDLLIKAGANVNARSVVDRGAGGRGGPRGGAAGAPPVGSGAAAAAAPVGFAAGDSASARIAQTFRRGSQMPSANAVPNQTALHGAAEHGFDKYIEFLVANGADLTAKDASGRTPLDVARGAGGVRGGADAFPKTVALLENMMTTKGIPVPAPPARQAK